MVSTARKNMDDDIIIIFDGLYEDYETKCRCRKYFDKLCEERKIRGEWESPVWKLSDGVNFYNACFDIDRNKYMKHGYKFIKMQPKELQNALRVYGVWCMGEFVFKNISSRIAYTIEMLERIGESDFKMNGSAKVAIEDFLHFIGISSMMRESITGRIEFSQLGEKGKRTLKPMLVYLLAAEKSKELMQTGNIEEKLKFFPVYLLSNLGPRLPLRATEWTMLPFDCLKRTEDGYELTVRRTDLKKGKRQVEYDVEKDYPKFCYNVPVTEEMQMIEWYIHETKEHERKYLFDYSETTLRDSMRGRFCTKSLNMLISEFFEEHLQDSPSLKWAMSVCNIKKLEPFTAGDMRPLALINIYFSGASLDACMELADHKNLETTYHYIGNIKEILEASAVMRIKRKLDGEETEVSNLRREANLAHLELETGCTSKVRRFDLMDLSECSEKCVNEKSCVGCPHYNPTEEEVLEFAGEKERELKETIEDFRDYINHTCCSTLDKELLRLQKAHEAYEEAYEMKLELELSKRTDTGGYYGI